MEILMKMPTANFNFYTKTIDKLAKKGQFGWGDLMGEIKGTKYEPKNWMTVRGCLQNAINTGKIHRSADLTKEIYVAS